MFRCGYPVAALFSFCISKYAFKELTEARESLEANSLELTIRHISEAKVKLRDDRLPEISRFPLFTPIEASSATSPASGSETFMTSRTLARFTFARSLRSHATLSRVQC